MSVTLRKFAVFCLIALLPAAVSQAETARYRATFDATWTAENHPVDFPSNAHFSRLVGGTHSDMVRFWEPCGTSTQGIMVMAEFGATGAL